MGIGSSAGSSLGNTLANRLKPDIQEFNNNVNKGVQEISEFRKSIDRNVELFLDELEFIFYQLDEKSDDLLITIDQMIFSYLTFLVYFAQIFLIIIIILAYAYNYESKSTERKTVLEFILSMFKLGLITAFFLIIVLVYNILTDVKNMGIAILYTTQITGMFWLFVLFILSVKFANFFFDRMRKLCNKILSCFSCLNRNFTDNDHNVNKSSDTQSINQNANETYPILENSNNSCIVKSDGCCLNFKSFIIISCALITVLICSVPAYYLFHITTKQHPTTTTSAMTTSTNSDSNCYGTIFTPVLNGCYQSLGKVALSTNLAILECQRSDPSAILPSIRNSDELDKAYKLASTFSVYRFWTSAKATNKIYRWPDNSLVNSSYWCRNEPTYECVGFYQNSTCLFTYPCTSSYTDTYTICKLNL